MAAYPIIKAGSVVLPFFDYFEKGAKNGNKNCTKSPSDRFGAIICDNLAPKFKILILVHKSASKVAPN